MIFLARPYLPATTPRPFRTLRRGEVVVQTGGDATAALLWRGTCTARRPRFRRALSLGGELADAMEPWFRLRRRNGVCVLVPSSAAERWISRHPALVRTLEQMDRVLARPFAPLGDHMLYWLEQTDVSCPGAARAVAPGQDT